MFIPYLHNAIVIAPTSGLANRMRVITTATQLARHTSKKVYVYWQKSKDCMADFSDLFCPVDPSTHISFIPNHSIVLNAANKRNLMLPHICRTILFSRQYRYFQPHTDLETEQAIMHPGNVYLSTCMALCKENPELMQMFHPIPPLLHQIEETSNSFDEHTYGIHIRRTDNVNAISHSPLTLFEALISSLIQDEPKARFFLSTDDAQIKTYLRQKFASHIVTLQNRLNRNTTEGMKDAVVDLWCLSKTTKVFGSYYSSFSETAAEIGRIPFEIVEKKR